MAETVSSPLLDLIKERGLLDDLQIEEITQEHLRTGKSISQVLQDFGFLDLDAQLQVMADHLGTEVVDLKSREISKEVLQTVPATTARMHQCLPVAVYDSTLHLAMADPLNTQAIDEIGYVVKKDIQVVVADPAQIESPARGHEGADLEPPADRMKRFLRRFGFFPPFFHAAG